MTHHKVCSWQRLPSTTLTHKTHVKHIMSAKTLSSVPAGKDRNSLVKVHTQHSAGSHPPTHLWMLHVPSTAILSVQKPYPDPGPRTQRAGSLLTGQSKLKFTANTHVLTHSSLMHTTFTSSLSIPAQYQDARPPLLAGWFSINFASKQTCKPHTLGQMPADSTKGMGRDPQPYSSHQYGAHTHSHCSPQ